jgi:hypothetical protein
VANAKPNGLYVISDLRYKSEIKQLRDSAGPSNVLALRVERFDSSPVTDPSERDLDDWSFDYYINNRESEFMSKEQVFDQAIHAIKLLWTKDVSVSSAT